jgi:hypothetical protein
MTRQEWQQVSLEIQFEASSYAPTSYYALLRLMPGVLLRRELVGLIVARVYFGIVRPLRFTNLSQLIPSIQRWCPMAQVRGKSHISLPRP